jgi:hypothetical protein
MDRDRIVDHAANTLGVIAQPLAPAFWSSQVCMWLSRSPKPTTGTAILIRTGNRRSASAIISWELAAIVFLFRSWRPKVA